MRSDDSSDDSSLLNYRHLKHYSRGATEGFSSK